MGSRPWRCNFEREGRGVSWKRADMHRPWTNVWYYARITERHSEKVVGKRTQNGLEQIRRCQAHKKVLWNPMCWSESTSTEPQEVGSKESDRSGDTPLLSLWISINSTLYTPMISNVCVCVCNADTEPQWTLSSVNHIMEMRLWNLTRWT